MGKNVVCPDCGGIFDPSALRSALPRSPKQHKAFFQMVRIAVNNWPHDHKDFQPIGATRKQREEHMRAWLLVKAKYRITIGEPLTQQAAMNWEIVKRHLAAAMQPSAHHPYRFSDEENGAVVVHAPKSIDWFALDHYEFQPVFDEVMFIIERETGTRVVFIKQELRKFG